MRLLFVIHALSGGGAERVMSTLIQEFVKNNSVALLTNLSVPFSYSIPSSVKLYDIKKGCPAVENNIIDKVSRYYRKLKNIRKCAKLEKPDYVISFIDDMNYDVLMALLGTGFHVICSEHTNILRKRSFKTNILKNIFYPFASAVTVLTRHDYKIWKNKFKNVVYMPNPISIEHHCITDKKKNVIAVGRVSAWYIKGFDNLIKCWSVLCNDFPDWCLQIVGKYDDASKKKLDGLITKDNCRNIEFLGFRSDVQNLMEQSSIFCLSSRIEGLPMSLLEAMKSNCCCVSFDCKTGPSEIIKNGYDGILVKNQNNQEMIDALRLVMSDDQYRNYLSNNSCERLNRFSIDRISSRWQILFDKIKR